MKNKINCPIWHIRSFWLVRLLIRLLNLEIRRIEEISGKYDGSLPIKWSPVSNKFVWVKYGSDAVAIFDKACGV